MVVADRLYRSRNDRMLAGVAGGVAEMLALDTSLVRIVWALLVVLTGGIALVLYIIMAFVVPEAPDGYVDGVRPTAATAEPPIQPTPGGWVAPDASVVPSAASVSAGGWVGPDGSVVPMAGSSDAPIETGRSRRRDRDRSGGLIAGLILILIGGYFLVRQFLPDIDPGVWWPVAAIIGGVLLVVFAVLPPKRPRG
jgi:phage shock protein PspC (stress-responsive transcriptional regulator)